MSFGIIAIWIIVDFMLSECPLVGHHGEVIVYHNCTHIQRIRMFVKRVYIHLFYFGYRAEVQNRLHQDQDYPCEVVGSWNTWYGDQDQAGRQQCNN